ncbi:TetR/AcrR family transcriptional regulator [Paenibacillus hodogayensis]|uniref:TetR/AcrR family transcriptional regulator n=1 Tax=Paenibacillus hodogayensis TaxID=279208 RepID=A0ABV5W6P5_9BACL
MARNASKDRLQREARRQQILDAALEVFSRRGLVASKMSEIAAAVGLSHANLYNYFASKEEIYAHLLGTAGSNFVERLSEARAQPGLAIDKLRWLAETYVQSSDIVKYFLLVLQAKTVEMFPYEEKQAMIRQSVDNYRPLIQIMEEGQRDGSVIQGDPEEKALLFISLLHGIILLPVKGYPQVSLSAVDTIMRLIKSP